MGKGKISSNCSNVTTISDAPKVSVQSLDEAITDYIDYYNTDSFHRNIWRAAQQARCELGGDRWA
ncbi:hypothetical protein ACWGTI_26865 [Mesorhizobium sp. ArgA1]